MLKKDAVQYPADYSASYSYGEKQAVKRDNF
jgi:hypothetical protein